MVGLCTPRCRRTRLPACRRRAPRRLRTPTDGRELAHAEALLRALAETTEDELDTGRWEKRVQTCDGDVELTLTLPYLLEAEAGHISTASRSAATPRVAERGSVRIARLTEGRSFESLDDLNAEIDRASERGPFDVPAEEAAGRELTAIGRAQELAYDAMDVGIARFEIECPGREGNARGRIDVEERTDSRRSRRAAIVGVHVFVALPIPQGTLDMLILQILSLEPPHGYGIAQRLQQVSSD